MGYALAKEQQQYVASLVKKERFNNQSEAVREAIRRMRAQETEYLTPPPLTPAQVEFIYEKTEKRAAAMGAPLSWRCVAPLAKAPSREGLGGF